MKINYALLAILCMAGPAHGADKPDPLDPKNFQSNPLKNVCQDKVFISDDTYQKDKNYWDQVVGSCHAPVEILPPNSWAGWMQGILGRTTDQVKSVDLLKKVGEKAHANQEFNNLRSELWAHCAGDKDPAWFKKMQSQPVSQDNRAQLAFNQDFYDQGKCEQRLGELRKSVTEFGPMARKNLALMKKVAGNGSKLASLFRTATGQRYDIETSPLSSDEQTKVDAAVGPLREADTILAKQAFEDGFKAIEQWHRDNKGVPDTMIPSSLFKDPVLGTGIKNMYVSQGARAMEHLDDNSLFLATVDHFQASKDFNIFYEKYNEALGSAPIVAYLNKPEPTDADLAVAAKKLLENGKQNLAEIDGALHHKMTSCKNGRSGAGCVQTEQYAGDQEAIDGMLPLLQYGGALREALKENPNSCRVAAGLVNFGTSQKSKYAVPIMAGVAAAGILATVAAGPVGTVAVLGPLTITGAGIAAATVGGATMVGFTAADWNAYQAANRRAFSVGVTSGDGVMTGQAMGDVGEAMDARNQFAIDAGINAAVGAFGGVAKGVKLLGQAVENQNLNRAAIAALVKSGKSEESAKATLKASRGGAGSPEAVEASHAIALALGSTDQEINLTKQLQRLGALNPQTKDRLAKNLYDLRALPEAKRTKMLEDLNSLVGELQSSDFNPSTQADALDAMFAAARFGHTPEQMKTVLRNNFKGAEKEAYKGLSAAYEKANKLMETPEFQGIKDPMEREQAALDRALEKDFNVPKEERGPMVKCAVPGGRAAGPI